MFSAIRRSLTTIGMLTSRPAAFVVLIVYTVLWYVFERETFDWHAVATLATWAMTLFIQRAEHRDTQALQAKLDELLRIHEAARSNLARIDEREPEEIERQRTVDQQRSA